MALARYFSSSFRSLSYVVARPFIADQEFWTCDRRQANACVSQPRPYPEEAKDVRTARATSFQDGPLRFNL